MSHKLWTQFAKSPSGMMRVSGNCRNGMLFVCAAIFFPLSAIGNAAQGQNEPPSTAQLFAQKSASEQLNAYYSKLLDDLSLKKLSRTELINTGLIIYNEMVNRTHKFLSEAPSEALWLSTVNQDVAPLFKISPANNERHFREIMRDVRPVYQRLEKEKAKLQSIKTQTLFSLQFGFNAPEVVLRNTLDGIVSAYALQEQIDHHTASLRSFIQQEQHDANAAPNTPANIKWRAAAQAADLSFSGKMVVRAYEETQKNEGQGETRFFHRLDMTPGETSGETRTRQNPAAATNPEKSSVAHAISEEPSAQKTIAVSEIFRNMTPGQLVKLHLSDQLKKIKDSDMGDQEKLGKITRLFNEANSHYVMFGFAPNSYMWLKSAATSRPLLKATGYAKQYDEIMGNASDIANLLSPEWKDRSRAESFDAIQRGSLSEALAKMPHFIDNVTSFTDLYNKLAQCDYQLKSIVVQEWEKANAAAKTNPNKQSQSILKLAQKAMDDFVNVMIVSENDYKTGISVNTKIRR